MTTEKISFGTLCMADVLASPESCYYGPTNDRMPIAEAHRQGILHFIVNRSHIYCKIGDPTTLGHFRTIEEAVECARQHKDKQGLRISAIAAPFGFTDECILWCNYWKPFGDI